MTYRVEISNGARKQIKRLDRSTRERVEDAIDRLAANHVPTVASR